MFNSLIPQAQRYRRNPWRLHLLQAFSKLALRLLFEEQTQRRCLMLQFHKILHPHDFSPHARYAFELACSLARDHGADVVVLHVNPFPVAAPLPYGAGSFEPEAEVPLEARLGELQSPFPLVKVEHAVVTGDIVPDILRFARQEGCDLIVMGTHGRKGFGHFLMGSVAEQITRHAPCPVVTVRNPAVFAEMPEVVMEEVAV
jgi:nucleotide-binding universal stress UspA family protein